MSAATVVRSACHALRRPLFPRAVMVMERQPPRRFSQRVTENFSVRRFHSSDCRKPATKPATATVEDSTSLKFDRIMRGLDELEDKLVEIEELKQQRRRCRQVLAGTVVAGVLAAIYVKRRFFGGANKEDDKEI